jgi:hypothetical protein
MTPFEDQAKKSAGHWLIPGYNLPSNAHKPAIWILKAPFYPVRSIRSATTMALLGQDQERPSGETAWTVLDAANDLGDVITIDACRRVIDADLRGEPPARSDVAVLSAFFS